MRANSKKNTSHIFLPEKYFQSLLPPVKILTNALIFLEMFNRYFDILCHMKSLKVILYSKKESMYF